MSNIVPVIAIDGPSGSGKGTISRLLAGQTGFSLLDSGALYRLTALAALTQSIELNNQSELSQVAKHLDVVFKVGTHGVATYLEGREVSQEIRGEEIGMAASKVAAYPLVREALLDRQRAFRQAPGLVADGRDMGTVVFADAEAKIFLTADANERAQRRYLQLRETGQPADFDEILKDIEARDARDMARTASPLAPADDALVIDSTSFTIDEVLQQVKQFVDGKLTF